MRRRSDLELLREFEPILRFTRGEPFYPADVEPYIRGCGLWLHGADARETCLVPEGQLDLDRLVEPRDLPADSKLYLRSIGPLNLAESAQAVGRRALAGDRAGSFAFGQGRLSRVGFSSRVIDALFSVSLFLRGRVPGAIAAAAEMAYRQELRDCPQYVYYGRVLCGGSWISLQYWFFYHYNCWRSRFQGVNDHEADWELVTIYLYEDAAGNLVPRWTAYSSHDFGGPDIRRRWDDTDELEVVDGHPVVYVGAGSHACYYRPGEYQTEVALPVPDRLAGAARAWIVFWTRTLGQSQSEGAGRPPLRIPFVDYARGDGVSIGPGTDRPWSPVPLAPAPRWLTDYRGLWGLYAHDPISGENAPAGPMFGRDGRLRQSWFDPTGTVGLDTVPPPSLEARMLADRRSALGRRQVEISDAMATDVPLLAALGLEQTAANRPPVISGGSAARASGVAELAGRVASLRREREDNRLLIERLEQVSRMRARGLGDPPRVHVRRLAVPASESELRFRRLAELWAAVSVGAMLLVGVGLLLYRPEHLFVLALTCIGLFALIDSFLRGSLSQTIAGFTVTLAVVAIVVVVAHYWQALLVAAVVAAGVLLLWENLREIAG